jgi:hypothetical protein
VAVATISAVLLSGGPASAATHDVTVSFTAAGPSPESVTIHPGDRVTYQNDIDPNSGSLLGVVTGAVHSVTVQVSNAARTSFPLKPGEHQTLTYSQPVKVTYTATYQPASLLGLLSGKAMTATGTVTVADASGDSVPVVTPAPPAAGGTMSPQVESDQQGSSPARSAAGSSADANQDGPTVNYTPNAGDLAAGQVPRGSSVGVPRPGAASGAPQGTVDGVGALPRIGSAQSQPKRLDRASSDSAIGSLGLPAITAVVLLSMVSAGLVRTIMVRHASLA